MTRIHFQKNKRLVRQHCETNEVPVHNHLALPPLSPTVTGQTRSKSCCPGATAMHHSTLICSGQFSRRGKTLGTVDVGLVKGKQVYRASIGSHRCGAMNKHTAHCEIQP